MLKLYRVARTEAQPGTRGYTAPTRVPISCLHVMGIISTSSSQAALKMMMMMMMMMMMIFLYNNEYWLQFITLVE